MKHKTLSILLAVLMSMTACVASAYDAKVNGIYYNLNTSLNKATVTYRTKSSEYTYISDYSGNVIIPETILHNEKTYYVTEIENFAFWGCSELTSVEIPNNVITIGDWAFANCHGLTSVFIPSSVTSIGRFAFLNCESLSSVTIPNGVTSIGSSAFARCSALVYVTIPKSVISIDASTYEDCKELVSINVDSENPKYDSRNDCNAIIETATNTLVAGSNGSTIPNTVTSIGYGAFSFRRSLKNIVIPESVSSIGRLAFYGCTDLSSVNISNNVTSIGDYAFSHCTSITSFFIPGNLTSIAKRMFEGCSSLASISIPNSVTSIGDGTFFECSELTSIIIGKSVTSIAEYTFAGCNKLSDVYCYAYDIPTTYTKTFKESSITTAILHIPATSLNDYAATEPWSNFGTIVPIESSNTSLVLNDGESYTNDMDTDYDEISYTRNFTHTNWQALYVPFDMQYEDWKDDFEVARINNMNQYDDDDNGTIDRTVMEVIKVKSGGTAANMPYLIKAKTTGEKTITVTDATLYAAEDYSHSVSSWNTLFTFTGTYSGVSGATMFGNGYYSMGNGSLHQAASSENDLKPYRWYMAVTDRDGYPKQLGEVKIVVFGDDEETDNLTPTLSQGEGESPLYDLSGRRVTNPRHGIYVKNGRKVVIK